MGNWTDRDDLTPKQIEEAVKLFNEGKNVYGVSDALSITISAATWILMTHVKK